MKRLASALLILLVTLVATSCATAQPPEIKHTLTELCSLYQMNKPVIVEFRTWAIAHQDQIPAEIWQNLQKLDAVLPLLDARGQDVCALAAASDAFTGRTGASLDDLTSGVLKIVGVALQAKQAGLF